MTRVRLPDRRNAETITLTVPTRKEFREHLIEILEEAPIPEANYPANVPVREFFGGLQDRFTIVGSSPTMRPSSR